MNRDKSKKSNLFFSIIERITPIIAIIGALFIGSIVILLMGEDPIQVYKMMFGLAIGNRDGWGNVLFRATPLIFTGLAVAFAFRCGLFNIGGEGQVYVGAFLAAYIGFTFAKLPAILLIPITIAASALGGALWQPYQAF